MPLDQLLYRFRTDHTLAPNITRWETIAPRKAEYAPMPTRLHPRLQSVLQGRGIEQLYSHQAEALMAAERGENVVVVTPTASGKTLCYNLPVINHLLAHPTARALYLFPTKALSQDQRNEVVNLLAAVEAKLSAEVYDGDTPSSARRAIRAKANIIITNPDMLHTGILPHHTQWLSLWTNLRYIVIDEVHHYRGLFGSHFANLLRRLLRIAKFYGCQPQIISASATIANPGDLVERLTDAEFPVTVIDQNGAPQGAKEFIFWNPPPINEAIGLRRSALLEARRVAGQLLTEDVQTIVFTRSRLNTEILLRYLQEDAPRMKMPVESLSGYRGGYLPNERRTIEQGLKGGQIRGVVATNALELGIDIGQLDAVVLHGYPGSIASTWQRAGRAGRRVGRSVAIFVATADPLDQFMVNHPDWFFRASPEHARIHPDNLPILVNHLRCAAFELPFAKGEAFGRVPPEVVAEILGFLAEEGVIHEAGETYYWTAQDYPAEKLSLRTADSDGYVVTEQPGGIVIGEVDRAAAYQMCFPGAIYMHGGRQYLISELDDEQGRAHAQPIEVDYYTRVESKRTVRTLGVTAEVPMVKAWGEIEVTSRVTGYKRIKLHTHETLSQHDLELPEHRMITTGYWMTFDVGLEKNVRDYGPNWQAQRYLAREREGFRCADCRISEEELGRELDVHHKIPFREFGYVPGLNDGYLAANNLENLIALCSSCHHRNEPYFRTGIAAGLMGVANAVSNIAPLFLMCDADDIGMSTELRGVATGQPTIYLYDSVPGGVGFAEKLYELHDDLLHATATLIRDCPCDNGCPACIGAEAMLTEGAKGEALALVQKEA